ncbi:LemA family protein [Moraxella boevrei]|uniref:LemA family protein n=1 Tax=Faucicola boevrei TaxID=346665 RepID=UPI00036C5B8C|nr:LemA family protein [Moraxella boevrei]
MKINAQTAKHFALATAIIVGSANLTGCGYNAMQAQDEQINASWSEVVNQYQRRADLIPNLVKVVAQYAQHEQATLTQVTQARSAATSIQVTPEVLNDPASFQRFQQAQDQLGGALSRLMAVSERYPDLKADRQFQELQAQLEGTENRITVARGRYIQDVQTYNTTVRQFPTNLTAKVFGMHTRPNFTVGNEAQISVAPTVDFGNNNNTANAGGQPVQANPNTANAGGQPVQNVVTPNTANTGTATATTSGNSATATAQ